MNISSITRNILLIFFSVIFSTNFSFAQEKYFNEALKRERESGQFYKIYNSKKILHLADFNAYAQKQGYIIGKHSMTEVARFGDRTESVGTFEFIPQEEYLKYIAESMGYTQPLNNQCQVFLAEYDGNDKIIAVNKHSNFYWTGAVQNDFAHGKGMGFVQKSKNEYILIKGSFYEGVIQGECERYKYRNDNKNVYFDQKKCYNMTERAGIISDGMTIIKDFSGYYGYIASDGTLIFPKGGVLPRFRSAQPFKNGFAEVTLDFDYKVKIGKDGIPVEIINADNLNLHNFSRIKELGTSMWSITDEYVKRYLVKKKPPFSEVSKYAKNFSSLSQHFQDYVVTYIKSITSFYELLKVEEIYPDLTHQIKERKLAIYKNDVEQLTSIYKNAVLAANNGKCNISDKDRVDETSYMDDYDPDSKKVLRKKLLEYYSVGKVVSSEVKKSYYSWDNIYRISEPDMHNPYAAASEICKREIKGDFGKYYQSVLPTLSEKSNLFRKTKESDYAKYISDLKIYNEINSSASSIPDPSYESEWDYDKRGNISFYVSWFSSGNGDLMTIRTYYYGGKSLWHVSAGAGLIGNYKAIGIYSDLLNARAAAYYWHKYSKIRHVGKVGD